jgi:ACS family hexuronate transporter-like MFS transporter
LPSAPRGQVRNVLWWIAALVFLATVINYVDRQTLSLVAPFLTKEFDISNVEYGHVLQSFMWAYLIMRVPAGILIDRWGARMMLAVSMVWWSLANALHATARGALGLGVFRFLLGVGEAGNFVAAEKVISEWYPPRERGLANGLVNAAASAGAIVAPPLIAWIYNLFGWRPAFVITGALGFVWLVGWLRWYYTPEEHPRITDEEYRLIRGPNADKQTALAQPAVRDLHWTHSMRFPQTWGLALARVFADPVWWFYLFWLPKYLHDERGFTMTEIGLVAWLPYLAADVGSIAGGFLSDRLVHRKVDVLKARKLAMLACTALMPVGILVAYTPSSAAAIAVICVVTFGHMAWKTNLMTITNDIYPRRIVASTAGIIGVGSGIGGLLSTSAVGYIIDSFSYRVVFIIMSFLHPIAMLIVWMMVHRSISDDDDATVVPASAQKNDLAKAA